MVPHRRTRIRSTLLLLVLYYILMFLINKETVTGWNFPPKSKRRRFHDLSRHSHLVDLSNHQNDDDDDSDCASIGRHHHQQQQQQQRNQLNNQLTNFIVRNVKGIRSGRSLQEVKRVENNRQATARIIKLNH